MRTRFFLCVITLLWLLILAGGFTGSIAPALIGGAEHGDSKAKIYPFSGKVVDVDTGKKKITLDHEEIPGLIKAMRMQFPVEDAKMLENIKPGDQVHGKLKAQQGGDYVIVQLVNQFEYFCPMHPVVIRHKPDYKCPICYMPLAKLRSLSKKGTPDEQVQQCKAEMAGLYYDFVSAGINESLSKLTADDRRLAEQQGWCPVLECNPLGSMGAPIKTLIKGDLVFLCCKSCEKKALANQEQALATVKRLRSVVGKQHTVKGKIVRITVTVVHEEIPEVLKAGTMEFTVDNPTILQTLKRGDSVEGELKLHVGDYKLMKLEKRK